MRGKKGPPCRHLPPAAQLSSLFLAAKRVSRADLVSPTIASPPPLPTSFLDQRKGEGRDSPSQSQTQSMQKGGQPAPPLGHILHTGFLKGRLVLLLVLHHWARAADLAQQP